MNPYEILGVDKEATIAEIKSAYRRLVKTAHPDVGGDKEEFEELQQAYDTLKDPDKRAYFDQTGKIKEPDKDRALDMLMALFNELLEKDIPLFVDYIEVMEGSLKGALDEINEQEEIKKTDLKKLSKLEKKFKRKKGSGSNFFELAVKGKITAIKAGMERAVKARETTERALELLSNFSFDVEKMPNKPDQEEKVGEFFEEMFASAMFGRMRPQSGGRFRFRMKSDE